MAKNSNDLNIAADEWKLAEAIVDSIKSKGEKGPFKIRHSDYADQLDHSFLYYPDTHHLYAVSRTKPFIPLWNKSRTENEEKVEEGTLGGGKFGTVRKAQMQNGQQAALKVLHVLKSKIDQANLKREEAISKELNLLKEEPFSRDLAAPIDEKHLPEKRYLMQELKPGCDLSQFISNVAVNQWNWNFIQRLKCALLCAQEIEKVHQNNIIHTDVKPENFLIEFSVDSEGNVVSVDRVSLIDFGTSFKLEEGRDIVIAEGNLETEEVTLIYKLEEEREAARKEIQKRDIEVIQGCKDSGPNYKIVPLQFGTYAYMDPDVGMWNLVPKKKVNENPENEQENEKMEYVQIKSPYTKGPARFGLYSKKSDMYSFGIMMRDDFEFGQEGREENISDWLKALLSYKAGTRPAMTQVIQTLESYIREIEKAQQQKSKESLQGCAIDVRRMSLIAPQGHQNSGSPSSSRRRLHNNAISI